jgi:hypothetical protein
MKFIAFLAFCCCLTLGNIQAQSTTTISSSTQTSISPDQRVKEFMQYMTKTYNLPNDQQYAVKKAGIALIDKARSAGNINARQKTAMVSEFNASILKGLDQTQKEHYLQAGQVTNPMIDAIINAATSK